MAFAWQGLNATIWLRYRQWCDEMTSNQRAMLVRKQWLRWLRWWVKIRDCWLSMNWSDTHTHRERERKRARESFSGDNCFHRELELAESLDSSVERIILRSWILKEKLENAEFSEKKLQKLVNERSFGIRWGFFVKLISEVNNGRLSWIF